MSRARHLPRPQADLVEARRLLGAGMQLVEMIPYTKRPAGDEWNKYPVSSINPDATGYGLILAPNKLCSIDPDSIEHARVGMQALGFDLEVLMAAGVRTRSTRAGSGGRSTFAAEGELTWLTFTSKTKGTCLEFRADSPNLQDTVPGIVYYDKQGNLCQQQYANCKRLDDAPPLPDDLLAWWERCSTDITFLREQQERFFRAIGDAPNLSISTGKGGSLAFAAPGYRTDYNRTHKVEELLDRHGYTWHQDVQRWAPPTASGAPGVRPIPGRDDLWRSDHASDPLHGTFDAWTAFVQLDHGGDLEAAKAAIDATRQPPPRDPNDPGYAPGDEIRTGQSEPKQSAPLAGASTPTRTTADSAHGKSLYALGRRLADAGPLADDELVAVLATLNGSRCQPPLESAVVALIAKNVANGASAWPEPANILTEAAAAAFEPGDVPAVLADYSCAWAEAAGFDPSASIACAVVTAAAALDDRIRLEVNSGLGWWESTRLWAALFTPPGGGKSPAIREMTRPLREIHREVVETYAAQPKPDDDDERPPMPAVYTNDCTTEKLSEVLRDNPRGLLFVVEEFDSWIGSHDAYRNGGGKDRGEWLQLFDGGPHQVDRIRRGSFFVPNWSVSLLSACTPSALRRYASKLPNDGLLQRVLPVLVRPARPGQPSGDLTAQRCAWDAFVRRLWALPGGDAAPSRSTVIMSDAAAAAFTAHAARYRELAQACGAYHEGLAGHVAKYGTLLARLSLTFHAATADRHPVEEALRAATVDHAARFLARAFRHARAFYAELGGSDTAWQVARRVAASLLADGVAEVSRRDLIQTCRAFRDATADQQTAAMQLLEDAGWVRTTDAAYAKGHPTRWLVSPAAHARYAPHGEAHRQRRAMVRQALHGGSDAPEAT